jgi:hypothetical protein
MIIQPRASQLPVRKLKTQWFHKVEACPTVCGQANDITGIGWNLRLKEDDIKHGTHFTGGDMCRESFGKSWNPFRENHFYTHTNVENLTLQP